MTGTNRAASRAVHDAIRETVDEAFAGRRGHGGAPVTRRSLTPDELRDILAGCLARYTRNLGAIVRTIREEPKG